MSDERHLKALQLLHKQPDMTQRELAAKLGVSLGAANYCLKALAAKGWVKLENFTQSENKLPYLYVLTPNGIKAKARLTKHFLARKLEEYDQLKAEIAQLRKEANESTKS